MRQSISQPHKLCTLTPIAAAVATALLGMSCALHAQETPAAAPQLDTVVVSANKRIEKLEDVPMSITVLSDALIQRNNVRTIDDLPALSPALSISYGTTPANNSINMRGIGTSTTGVGVEADVAVIIDDIPIGMQVQAFKDLSDVARIEVLKGPQSSLFGKSAVAGAINITTKPITGPIIGNSSMLYTSDNEWRITESIGGQINEKFGFRIAASDTDFPGTLHNLTDGSRENGSRGKTFMGKLDWHLTDDLDVQVSPHYNASNDNCCVTVLTGISSLNGSWNNLPQLPLSQVLAGINAKPGNVDFRSDTPTGQTSTDRGVGLRVNYAFPDHTPLEGYNFTSISSTNTYLANDHRNQSFLDVPVLLYTPLANGQPAGVDQDITQYGNFSVVSRTQEFRLTSPDSGAFRYVAGLWYADNDIQRGFVRGYNGVAISTPVAYYGDTYNRNRAIFAQSTWDFMPANSLIAGLRYNREVSGYSMALGNPPPGAFVPTQGTFRSLDNGEDKVTGRLGLEHHFNPDWMVYATESTGYKGKAYDLTSGLNAQTAAQQPIPAETSRNFEIGLKANLLHNRATMNLAIFNTTFSNYQQQAGSYLPGTTTYVSRLNSIGGVRTRGLEADGSWLALPNLVLNGNFAYTQAVITDWPNGTCYTVGSGFNSSCVLKNPAFGGANTQDMAGDTMPNAPKYKANLGGQYDIFFADKSYAAFITANWRVQSAVLFNINQDPSQAQGGFSIVNLGFGIRDKKDKYKLSFFVNNLFDKQYAVADPGVTLNAKGITSTGWVPARDAFRYEGVRFDMKF